MRIDDVGSFLGTVHTSQSPDETLAYGAALARLLTGGELVLLRGSLGAGKTVLARGLIEALGMVLWRGSPTFALVNEYATTPPVYHVDLYRLSESEVEDLGLEEYIGPRSVLLCEWPERAEHYLHLLEATTVVDVELTYGDEGVRNIAASVVMGSPVHGAARVP